MNENDTVQNWIGIDARLSSCTCDLLCSSTGIDGLSTEGYIPGEQLQGRIEFMDVRFTYPGKHDDIVSRSFTFYFLC